MKQQINESTVIARWPVPRPRLAVVPTPPCAEPVPRAEEPGEAGGTGDLASLGGVYTAPFGFTLNALINRTLRSVPLVFDDAAELPALERALDLVAREGGFDARVASRVDSAASRTRSSVALIVVRCRIEVEGLSAAALENMGAADERGSVERAVYRAAAALAEGAHDSAIAVAHNCMIESGVAAVALALGNAPGRVIAEPERHAARHGGRQPLCTWSIQGDAVEGELELPLDIATHGRWRAPAELTQGEGARLSDSVDIGMLAACIGMASSVVALEDAVRVRLQERRRAPPPARRSSHAQAPRTQMPAHS